MKGVLVSEKPIMCEKIIVGEKTIIVKKSAPKQVPFKCYIYMTQGALKDLGTYSDWIYENRMKVIGEFVCRQVECWRPKGMLYSDTVKKSGVSLQWLIQYAEFNNRNKEHCYAWHISDFKIYDKPKELGEFSRPCSYSGLCFSCKRASFNEDGNLLCNTEITRLSQSWLYVEE